MFLSNITCIYFGVVIDRRWMSFAYVSCIPASRYHMMVIPRRYCKRTAQTLISCKYENNILSLVINTIEIFSQPMCPFGGITILTHVQFILAGPYSHPCTALPRICTSLSWPMYSLSQYAVLAYIQNTIQQNESG